MTIRADISGLRQVDLNLLPLFVALMREKSVTRAGEAAFLSQPAASAALGRLRTAFHDKLFTRVGNSLEPTPRAVQLLADIEPLMREISKAVADSMPFDPATDSRTFRLGLGQDVAVAALALPAIFRREAPSCRLVLRASNFHDIGDMLDAGEIGSAIGFVGDKLPAGMKQKTLSRGTFKVMRDAGSPGPVDLDMFCERPHVLVTPRGDLVGFVDEHLRAIGRSRRVVLGIPSFTFLSQIIHGTDLLCTVSDALADAIMALAPPGSLAADPTPFETRESAIHMTWRAALHDDAGERWFRSLVSRVVCEQKDGVIARPNAA